MDHKSILHRIESRTFLIRGQNVMLDADLAGLYSVTTKRLNEQVVHNADRFPADFTFKPTKQELADLRSQIATSRYEHRSQSHQTQG